MSAPSARATEGRRRWPLWISLIVLWASLAALLVMSLQRTRGHLVYTLDDAYIHMAVAKHFARDGVWGLTPYAFSSSSSSLLWTGLLALVYRVVGPNEVAPLVLNLVFASLVAFVIHAGLKQRLADLARFLTLVFTLALGRVPVMALCGMEHTLQITLVTAFVFRAVNLLGTGRDPLRAPIQPWLFALAALLPLARYEGLFAVFVVSAALLARGRARNAIALMGIAIAPVVLYAAYSVDRGWFPLPNSVLIKGAPDGLVDWLARVPENLMRARPLAIPIAVGFVLFVHDLARGRDGWTEARVLLGLFLAVSLLHLQFAAVGSFYRYEAYLIALGVLAIAWRLFARPAGEARLQRAARPGVGWAVTRVFVVLAGLAIAWKTRVAYQQTPIATQNIYQQQYQMGRFLAQAYPGQSVAANDIGAINYLADLRCCDLMGLANMSIARLRLIERRTGAEDVDRVVRASDARIAVVYESWFGNRYVTEDQLPPRWGSAVARWSILDNVACGGDTVSFFALAPGEGDSLAARLRAFSSLLPPEVIQK